MNKLLSFSLVALLLSVTSFAQQKKATDMVKFTEMTYDFGKIKQGITVNHDFDFTNISNQPVVIESATGSCGCTTPVKPEKPIGKGKKDIVKAGFLATALGPFTKAIYVKLAGVDMPLELRISGQVLTPEEYAKYEEGKKKSGK